MKKVGHLFVVRVIFISILFISVCSIVRAEKQKKVLIFTKTTGFRHSSIPKGVRTVQQLLSREGIRSTHSEDVNLFHQDSLQQFDAVIFLSTTGDLFNDKQKLAFQQFIRSGKGFVGIHAASDTEFNWPWYGRLVGAYFSDHPEVQEAHIEVKDSRHLSTKHLPKVWVHRDEWYNFKDLYKEGLHILLNLDETSYQGGKMGKFHPVAWCQKFEGGRSFYTALGHTDESFDSELFQKHLLGGIRYALNIK